MGNSTDKNITVRIDNPDRHFMINEEENNPHPYLRFSDSPRSCSITQASFLIVDQLFKKGRTLKEWRKDKGLYTKEWINGGVQTIKSVPLNYLEIAKHIREKGYFNRLNFSLPPLECEWLDSALEMKFERPRLNEDGKFDIILDGTLEQNYGETFPITPKLDREGRSFTSLFPLLIRRNMRLRTQLIENSKLALTADWFLDVRTMICDAMSLLEITLHQLFIKAKYNPLSGWRFDLTKLGERHGRRFNDKLKWVYQITGNELHSESYIGACNHLREVRNHLMHFDPPTVVITAEDTAGWLNNIIDVGYLLIEIRKAINVPVSYDLINFILQKEAVFQPAPGFETRTSLKEAGTGYLSSLWPSQPI